MLAAQALALGLRLKLRWHKRNLSALIAFEAELRGQGKALDT